MNKTFIAVAAEQEEALAEIAALGRKTMPDMDRMPDEDWDDGYAELAAATHIAERALGHEQTSVREAGAEGLHQDSKGA